jgi:hypothetical protein
MGFDKLSNVIKDIKPRTISAKTIVYKLNLISGYQFNQTSNDVITEDKNEKVLCLLTKDKFVKLKNRYMDASAIGRIVKNYPNTSFYGVMQENNLQKVKKSHSMIDIDGFLEKEIINGKYDLSLIKYAVSNAADICHSNFPGIVELLDPNSFYVKYINIQEMFNKQLLNREILNIYETIKEDVSIADFTIRNPNLDIIKINEQFKEKYPLLNHIYSINKIMVKDVAQYINLIDKN